MAKAKRGGRGVAKAKDGAAKVQKTTGTKRSGAKPTAEKNAKAAKTEDHPATDNGLIVIEACKQCNAFKTRAQKLQTLITEGKPGTTVTINPEKPRRGCFEVRNTETGEKYVSLLDMPRPFPPLKALDIDGLGQTIVSKLG